MQVNKMSSNSNFFVDSLAKNLESSKNRSTSKNESVSLSKKDSILGDHIPTTSELVLIKDFKNCLSKGNWDYYKAFEIFESIYDEFYPNIPFMEEIFYLVPFVNAVERVTNEKGYSHLLSILSKLFDNLRKDKSKNNNVFFECYNSLDIDARFDMIIFLHNRMEDIIEILKEIKDEEAKDKETKDKETKDEENNGKETKDEENKNDEIKDREESESKAISEFSNQG